MTHLALRWILDHPAVSTVIAGVSRPQQLADNVAAAERPQLDEGLHQHLRDWYAERVRPAVRGAI
jgi:aryl-alcohol dehydrogenase-like predicted oxidoreductase